VERNIAYGIWRNLRRKVTNLARQAKRRYMYRFLNPSLPSKVLWKNLESIGVKDSVDANVIYSPAELSSYYGSLCSVAPPVTAHVINVGTGESRFFY
jgi:hypothetical protein